MDLARKLVVLMGKNPYIDASLLRDEFTTDVAAGSVNSTAAEPGPGTRAVVDAASKISISSGALQVAQGTAALENLGYNMALTRTPGLALFARACCQNQVASSQGFLGFHSGLPATTATPKQAILFSTSAQNDISSFGDVSHKLILGSAAAYNNFCIILGTLGCYYVVDDKLLVVDATTATTPLYVGMLTRANTPSYEVDKLRVAKLGNPWRSTYGPGALHTSGAIAAGTAFTHEADFLLYFTIANNGSAGSSVFKFRMQDANNYWILTISNDGSADLSEVVAGVATSRGTVAANMFGAARCSIRAVGTTIYLDTYGATRLTYASATNFQTSTAGELTSLATDAVFNNLEIYPVNLTGAALRCVQELEA